MKKEKSLIEVKENKFSKFLNSIKKFFYKLTGKENIEEVNQTEKKENQPNNPSPLDDVEILGKVLRGEMKSSDLDEDTKKRLMVLCDKREKEIREKIKKTNERISKIDSLLLEIEEIKNS